MIHRRGFLRHAAATSVVCVTCGMRHAAAQPRRQVTIGGRRVRTVDVHAHCAVPEVSDLVKGTAMERPALNQFKGKLGFPVAEKRVSDMDADGIDVAVLYPTLQGLMWVPEPDVFHTMAQEYNRWLHEYCSGGPTRLYGVGLVPLQDVGLAVKEMTVMRSFWLLRSSVIASSSRSAQTFCR